MESTPFADRERVLEDWVEANPHLVFAGERLAIVARQPRSSLGKYPDLIAIDESGACVVIELKRGETPREVLAQVLDYAAWVDSLTLEQLDALARDYARDKTLEISGVADLYQHTFGVGEIDEDEEASEAGDEGSVANRITFNHRQRLYRCHAGVYIRCRCCTPGFRRSFTVVIIAEHFSQELEQTLRYLRTRFAVDVAGVSFTPYQEDQETVLATDVVVGREAANTAAAKAPSRQSPLTSIEANHFETS